MSFSLQELFLLDKCCWAVHKLVLSPPPPPPKKSHSLPWNWQRGGIVASGSSAASSFLDWFPLHPIQASVTSNKPPAKGNVLNNFFGKAALGKDRSPLLHDRLLQAGVSKSVQIPGSKHFWSLRWRRNVIAGLFRGEIWLFDSVLS